MKCQQFLNPHGMRPLKMPSQQPACAGIRPFLRGPDGLRDRLIDRRELVSIPALGLVLLHPLMQLFVVALGVRVVVDTNPAVDRSSQKVVERRPKESLLLFERSPDLEVAAGLEFERCHQLPFAKSPAPPISCPMVVPDFETIVDLVLEHGAGEFFNQLLKGASREDNSDLAGSLPELLVGEVALHQRQAKAVETLAVCLQAIARGDAAERRQGFTATLSQQRYISGGSSSLGASRTGIVPDDDLLAASAMACARLCDSSHFKCPAMSRSALLGSLHSSLRSFASSWV